MSLGSTEVVVTILGGAVLSAAISTIMAAFGSAIGLSLVSAETSRSSSMTALAMRRHFGRFG